MLAVIGAAGNVGYSTVSALREAGAPVRAILHDASKASRLEAIGCEIALGELQEPSSLREAIAGADALQVIVPLRPDTPDPASDMHRSIDGIIAALQGVRPDRVLAISDYGAHVAADIGMPSIFHAFEHRLRQLGGRTLIVRSAEHMHNLARAIPPALETGSLTTFQAPIDRPMPTISAEDLGRIAADLLLRPDRWADPAVVHAEGPRRYSASDVAAALSALSGRAVRARAVPRSQWGAAFQRTPAGLADLLIKANDAKNKGGLVDVEPGVGEVRYGTTELIDGLRPLIPPR